MQNLLLSEALSHSSPPSWKGLLNGEAYQNAPSLQYQPRERALDMYYGANLCRLVQIKRKYDPSNFFSGEQTIPPSLSGCGAGA